MSADTAELWLELLLCTPERASDPLPRCPCAGEYLFAPYSVFTLIRVQWSEKINVPHKLVLQAATDNSIEEETLPLAPWY